MRKRSFILLSATLLTVFGCQEKDLYQYPDNDGQDNVYNDFDFSTVAENVSLNVTYNNGGIPSRTRFEVYDENPVKEAKYGYVKRDDVMPLFTAYTDSNGKFTGSVDLPAYLKEVYIYSPDFQARTLIKAEMGNGAIVASDETDNTDETTRAGAMKVADATNDSYDSYMVTDNPPTAYSGKRWKTWLGEYDKKRHGEVNYKYTGTELAISDFGPLYEAHNRVIPSRGTCPDAYRSYTDLYINEDAEMAVTFLGQNSCWNCSLGYYYYKNGEKPASLDEANIIMLFPNTQDGKWSGTSIFDVLGQRGAENTAGIDRGTTVQLKYYGDTASDSEGSTVFPAGYRIGFVLATNAWSNRVGRLYNDNKRYRSATSEGLSVNNSGNTYAEPRTAAYKYGDQIMISFEDYITDENFSDVVITMKSNPVTAVSDIVEVNPENTRITSTTLKGIYVFEDQWPSQGDYDMNDVMVRHNYTKEFDKDNNIYSETFTFTTYQNYAELVSGLALRITPDRQPAKMEYAVRKPGKETFTEAVFAYESADNVYRLTDNINGEIGTEYQVKFIYDDSAPATEETQRVEPFIYRNTTDGKRLEVHIVKEAPTSLADMTMFGKDDDRSDPDNGIWYVRKGKYPFAFFLAGADENDLAPMLDSKNETVNMGTLYPRYDAWVMSKGTAHQDWYKKF